MLNSVEHEILNAHKYKNIKKVGFLLGSDKPRMLFSRSKILKCQQLLAFYHLVAGNNSCSVELSMEKVL